MLGKGLKAWKIFKRLCCNNLTWPQPHKSMINKTSKGRKRSVSCLKSNVDLEKGNSSILFNLQVSAGLKQRLDGLCLLAKLAKNLLRPNFTLFGCCCQRQDGGIKGLAPGKLCTAYRASIPNRFLLSDAGFYFFCKLLDIQFTMYFKYNFLNV